mmetsp:Transcript_14628/g.21368  ORF Transcript_14628/g.21368 Transcript_14628/m.21368 type:complete len:406 (+) Transcript_14628:39-1256(+)|eukprot:15333070-Ditylum_brightwellii.AAC.1
MKASRSTRMEDHDHGHVTSSYNIAIANRRRLKKKRMCKALLDFVLVVAFFVAAYYFYESRSSNHMFDEHKSGSISSKVINLAHFLSSNSDDHSDVTSGEDSHAESILTLNVKDVLGNYASTSLGENDDKTSQTNDIAFFLHVPKSGGSVIKDIFSTCYTGLTRAEIVQDLRQLRILPNRPKYSVAQDAARQHHQEGEGALMSGLLRPDIVFSSSLFDSLEVLQSAISDPDLRMRLFIMLRHPVERSESIFQYLIRATWEPTFFPALAGMTRHDVIHHGILDDNWLTRTLTNSDISVELTSNHVEQATKILRSKFLIGLSYNIEESWLRIRDAFGWRDDTGESHLCSENMVWKVSKEYASVSADSKYGLEQGSVEWQLLESINTFDVQVYNNAIEIFKEQRVFFQK